MTITSADTRNPFLAGAKVSVDLNTIQAVHLPMRVAGSPAIDGIESPYGQLNLKRVCERMLDTFGHRPMHIIGHYYTTKTVLESVGAYSDVIREIQKIMIEYPLYTLCIENVTDQTLMEPYKHNVILAEDIDLPNVGTCIDTCHALIIKEQSRCTTAYGAYPTSLINFFDWNKELCRHIHLADATWVNGTFGMDKGHGAPFSNTTASRNTLEMIENWYRKLGYTADIVHEVREHNILEARNYSIQKEIVGDGFETNLNLSNNDILIPVAG